MSPSPKPPPGIVGGEVEGLFTGVIGRGRVGRGHFGPGSIGARAARSPRGAG
ncbi:hypothetical protein ES5_07037, partial [Dietzia cinnamea P4]